jgi:MHS family proline/betaine transporter-like MFS transporter
MTQKSKTTTDIRMLLSGSVGNILEWYDFAVYGYMAKTIAPLFFPTEDKMAATVSVFGVFAAGFLMRPLGAILFGFIGDKHGRKRALMLSVILMAISTVGMGLLPTHAAIGMAAPVALTLMRLLQGISVGGELTTSISFIVEKAPPGRRGYYGAWTTFSAVLGILIGSAIGAAIESLLTADQISAWGWRLPFLLGAILGTYALIMRRTISESESFEKLKAAGELIKSPLKTALRSHGKTMIRIVGTLWLFAVGFYLPFVYLPTYLANEDQVPLSIALDLNSIAMALLLVFTLWLGLLSDKFGRKKIILFGYIGYLVVVIPVFQLFATQDDYAILAGMSIFAVVCGAAQGAIPAFISEHFPGNIRVSALSFAYNLALAVFGGTTPLVCAWLIGATGSDLAPAYYLAFTAVVSILSILTLKETYKDVLE